MNWRSPRYLIPLALICVVLVGVSLFGVSRLLSCGHSRATTSLIPYPPDAVTVPPLPTPGLSRTVYTNSKFGYSIQYPMAWLLFASSSGSVVDVSMVAGPAYPEALAFTIEYTSNPQHLPAALYWQQNKGSDQQDVGYLLYTLTDNQTACQIFSYEVDADNARIIFAAVTTFRWH